jgi:multicomponent Na+:H+ antiporter subunit B
MKIAGLLLALLTGGLLIYGEQDMPGCYIEKALEETGAPNMVTAVLADYRSFDTLGETTVIFTAGLSCLLLLRRDSE